MADNNTSKYELPAELRAMTERGVEQAKSAFDKYMQAAHEVLSPFDQWFKASQAGAHDIGTRRSPLFSATCSRHSNLRGTSPKLKILRKSQKGRPSTFDRKFWSSANKRSNWAKPPRSLRRRARKTLVRTPERRWINSRS